MIIERSSVKGVLFAVMLGTLFYFVSIFIPSLNSIVLGLLAGIVIGNIFSIPNSLSSGISFTSSKLLELSVIFIAFGINLGDINKLGISSLLIIVFVLAFILFFTLYLSRKMQCSGSTSWLIGFGTAICGSSAIAAAAPKISKNKEDVGIALAVVNLLGALGMLILPAILLYTGLSNKVISLIIGGSLHAVGNVAGAGYAISDEVGLASITVKLARVALLSPALIFFNYLINKDNVSNWKQHFKLPLYIWIFIAISIIVSVVEFPIMLLKSADSLAKYVLTVAMTAIGIKVSFKALYQSGRRALIFGVIIFAAQVILLLVLGLALE